jgi:hypothetical protein
MSVTTDLEDFLGEEVVDRQGETVGTFACYWHSFEGKVAVLGVEMENDPEKTHLVPVRGMRADERHSCIRLSFSRSKVERAPALDCDQDLEADIEEEVYRYYELEAPKSFGHLQIRKLTTS